MTGEGDKPIQGKREKTKEGDGKGMTGEERKNRNRRGKLSTIDNTKNCLIRGINMIKYKNVDNTKKYDFFASIIVLFFYIYTCLFYFVLINS
jgi:hypothetical protein